MLSTITATDSPMTVEDYLSNEKRQTLSTPTVAVDETAPDFALAVHDFSTGRRVPTSATFHLLDVAMNQPVALIFGSYT